jgi:hypothetical protein
MGPPFVLREQLVAVLVAATLPVLLPMVGNGQTQKTPPADDLAPTQPSQGTAAATLRTLGSFVDVRKSLLGEIEEVNRELAVADSDVAKKDLKSQLEKLEADLRAITANLENVAAGVDITSLRTEAAEEFSFQREVLALLKPALDEMKEMTAHVRQKSDLREKIASYEERLPIIERPSPIFNGCRSEAATRLSRRH